MVVERLEHKLGIRASDTATIRFTDCRVPKANLLGSPEIEAEQGFAGVMQTFDNTRPLVAGMAVGCARAALDETEDLLKQAGVEVDYDKPAFGQHAAAAAYLQMEADWEAAYLLTMEATWMADNNKPNSLQASMAKAKAGPGRHRDHAALRRARRRAGLQRGVAAGEVGPRLEDPRHLRGHPADPAADRRPAAAQQVVRRAQVAPVPHGGYGGCVSNLDRTPTLDRCGGLAGVAPGPVHDVFAGQGGAARRVHRRAPAAAQPRPPAGRAVVLRRPLRTRRHRGRARHAGSAAPAHRPADGELAAQRRGAPPRQPRPRHADPARRARPDDRRRRRSRTPSSRPPRTRRCCTASSCGWRCRMPRGRRAGAGSTTPTCRCSPSAARRRP